MSQRLPEPLPQPADQTVEQYALSLFRFVLATDVTATLSDTQLELAGYAGAYAATIYETVPPVRESVSKARHLIARAIARRTQDAAERAELDRARGPRSEPYRDGRPSDPQGARLSPPNPRPLAPVGAVPDVRF